jgi:hypothetical protein
MVKHWLTAVPAGRKFHAPRECSAISVVPGMMSVLAEQGALYRPLTQLANGAFHLGVVAIWQAATSD